MHYFNMVHTKCVLGGVLFYPSFERFKSSSFCSLMLNDGGCLNSLLPVDIFPLTSIHILWDQDLEIS